MNQLKTVESKVLTVLKACPETRYNDMLLILRYYNRFSDMPVGDFPFEDVIYNYKGYGLPCFETIRRARQRVQSLFPELSRRNNDCCNKTINIRIDVNVGGMTNEREFYFSAENKASDEII